MLRIVRATIYSPSAFGSLVFSNWVEEGVAYQIAEDVRREVLLRAAVAREVLSPEHAAQVVAAPHLWLPMPELEAERPAGRALGLQLGHGQPQMRRGDHPGGMLGRQHLPGDGGARQHLAPHVLGDLIGDALLDPIGEDQAAEGRGRVDRRPHDPQHRLQMRVGRTAQEAQPQPRRDAFGGARDVETPLRREGRNRRQRAFAFGREQRIVVVLQDPQLQPASEGGDGLPPRPTHGPARGVLHGRHQIDHLGAGAAHRRFQGVGSHAFRVHLDTGQAIAVQLGDGLQAIVGGVLAEDRVARAADHPQRQPHGLLGAGGEDQPLPGNRDARGALQPGRDHATMAIGPGRLGIVQDVLEIGAAFQPRQVSHRRLIGDHVAREVDDPVRVRRCVAAGAGVRHEGAAADLADHQAPALGLQIGLGDGADAEAQPMGQDALGRQALAAGQGAGGGVTLQRPQDPLVKPPGLVIEHRRPGVGHLQLRLTHMAIYQLTRLIQYN